MASSIYLAHEWVNPMAKFHVVSWRNIKLKNKTAIQGTSHVFYLVNSTGEENSVRSNS